MVVCVPRDLVAFERILDAKRLRSLPATRLSVFLPRFRVTSKFGLAETPQGTGVPTPFTAKADFRGISDRRGEFISAVEHKAFVDVREAGTDAAAATAVVMSRGGRPAAGQRFQADRPFLFLTRDTGTGSILFVGRVVYPRAAD